MALLQYVPDDQHLCNGVTEIYPDGEDQVEEDYDKKKKVIHVPSSTDGGVGSGSSSNSTTDGDNDNNSAGKKNAANKKKMIHITPSHGVPVALLAKRGQCTYETKARVASTLTSPHGVVRFVIVYDDKMEDGEHLITMMPRDGQQQDEARRDLYEELGLVFVSYESGMGEFHAELFSAAYIILYLMCIVRYNCV